MGSVPRSGNSGLAGYADSDELTKHQIISRLPTEPYLKKFEYDTNQVFTNADTAKLKNRIVC
jgi:hypothetical protein